MRFSCSAACAVVLLSVSWPAAATDAGTASVTTGDAGVEVVTDPPAKKSACPCAVPRLVRRGMPRGALDLAQHPIPVWLDDANDKSKRELAAYALDKTTVLWRPGVDDGKLKLRTEALSIADYGPAQDDTADLLRVHADQELSTPFLLGMKPKKAKTPSDRWKLDKDATPRFTPPTGSTNVAGVFLGPFDEHEKKDCGATRTHKAWVMERDDAAPAIAWIVEGWVDDERKRQVTLVDHRHLETFGIGHVADCRQGLKLDENRPMQVRLRPVSAAFEVGEPWTFTTPGRPTQAQLDEAKARAAEAEKKKTYASRRGQRFLPVPTLQQAPSSRDAKLENPFLKGLAPPTLSHEKDAIALGAMLLLLVGAGVVAWLLRVFKKPKPYVVEVACPACDDVREVDLSDPKTDGTACPACGTLYVSLNAAGPLPHIELNDAAKA